MEDQAWTSTSVPPRVRGTPVRDLELTTGGMSQDAADMLAALTARAAGAPTAMIHIAAGETLRLAGSIGLPESFRDAVLAPSDSTLAGWIIANNVPLIVEDFEHDSRVPAAAPARAAGVCCYAGFPVRDPGGEIVGVCAVCDYHPRTWTAAQLAAVDEGAQACTAFVAAQRAREDADRQRRFLAGTLESLTTGVAACGADGELIFTNEAMRRMSAGPPPGGDVREWVRAPVLTDPGGRPVLPQDLPLLRALAGERLRGVEVVVRVPGRPMRVVRSDAQPILDAEGRSIGAVVAADDATEQFRTRRFREAEAAVSEALAHAESVRHACPRVLAAIAGTLRWPHAELWTVEDDTLTRAADIGGADVPDDGALARAAWRRGTAVWTHDLPTATATAPARVGVAVPVPSGDRVLAVLTCYADAFDDPPDALVELLSGIAARIGQFLERRRAEELALALARSKDEYLALVGHELRTPLTTISSYLDLVRDVYGSTMDTDGRAMLDAMARCSADLRDIVEQLLDLAALDSGHATVDTVPVDLTRVVQDAVTTTAVAAATAGVTVDADLTAGTSAAGDATRLRQVAVHLLHNAIAHSAPGGHVTVTLGPSGPTTVELAVTDAGLGVPADEQGAVFTRFFRSSRTRDNRIPGAGLGLAISRAIVDRHRGDIRLVPRPGPGTRIVVRLPVAS